MSSQQNNQQNGWYKAGKDSKKRKAVSPLEKNKGKAKGSGRGQNESDGGGQSTAHVEQPVVSTILSEANEVLYGDSFSMTTPTRPSDTTTREMMTSTPGNVSDVDTSVHIAETNKKLDFILEKLSKLDKIEEKIDRIESTVKKMEKRVSVVEKKTDEFEKSVNFMSDKIDDYQTKLKEISKVSEDIRKQEKALREVCDEAKSFRKERDEMRDSVIDLQCRSMKNNLVFTGLGGESYDEDTECKLKDFLYHELGIDDKIEFCNVHRFGRFVGGRRRPIVARFLFYRDLQLVKDSAYKLKGKPYGINEQFPAVIEERRKKLYPVVRRLKQEGEKPKLVRDKLFVNGRLYDASDEPRNIPHRPLNGVTFRSVNSETVPKTGPAHISDTRPKSTSPTEA